MSNPEVRLWPGPVELLIEMGELGIRPFVYWDNETYERRLKVIADPFGALTDDMRWHLAAWEKKLIVCIDERRLRPAPPAGAPTCPNSVAFGKTEDGEPAMRYTEADGTVRLFTLLEDGRWAPI